MLSCHKKMTIFITLKLQNIYSLGKGYIGMVIVNGVWLLLTFCCLVSWSFKLKKLSKSFDHWNLVPSVITAFLIAEVTCLLAY